jgi:chromosome partitioning protein
MTQIVSFIIQKGGCGKTTTTANTGGYLSMQGYKVLCVDMDPQGNLTQHFGYDSESLNKSILHLFQENASFEQVVLKRSENLHLLPNNLETASTELQLYHTLSREYMLRNILTPIISHYDFILIDCPPALSLFSINALATSTEFLLVVAPEFFPMKAIKPLYETYRMVKQKLNHTLQFNGVLMTMCDFRTNHSQQIYNILKKNFPHKLYDSYIRNNVALKEASSYGQTIFEYAHNSIGAYDYQNFVEEFIKDHHKNIAKRNFYQQKYDALSPNDKKKVMLYADRNLSQYNKNRLELAPTSKALREAIIVERNKILEKLFPYRINAEVASVE